MQDYNEKSHSRMFPGTYAQKEAITLDPTDLFPTNVARAKSSGALTRGGSTGFCSLVQSRSTWRARMGGTKDCLVCQTNTLLQLSFFPPLRSDSNHGRRYSGRGKFFS